VKGAWPCCCVAAPGAQARVPLEHCTTTAAHEHADLPVCLRVQAAQAQAQERLEQALQDLEQLKSENLEAWREENEAEVQLASCRATLAAREGQACCMQQVWPHHGLDAGDGTFECLRAGWR
jgi:septal ring factor EnvC (AmiA/AmiB activator)